MSTSPKARPSEIHTADSIVASEAVMTTRERRDTPLRGRAYREPGLGGAAGNRTRVQGFAGPCLSHSATTPGIRRSSGSPWDEAEEPPRADDGTRTRDPHLGKVMRYQRRHARVGRGGSGGPTRRCRRKEHYCITGPPLIAG